jgi:hypothetical protein
MKALHYLFVIVFSNSAIASPNKDISTWKSAQAHRQSAPAVSIFFQHFRHRNTLGFALRQCIDFLEHGSGSQGNGIKLIGLPFYCFASGD